MRTKRTGKKASKKFLTSHSDGISETSMAQAYFQRTNSTDADGYIHNDRIQKNIQTRKKSNQAQAKSSQLK